MARVVAHGTKKSRDYVEELRVGFIGAGRISDLHALHYMRDDRARIVAVCDANPRVARQQGIAWGVAAILSNILLTVFSSNEQRCLYFASLSMLILFVISYHRLSKPINQIQTEAAKNGESLNNGRELQASWDRSLIIRVPLLVVSLLAQCLALLVAFAYMCCCAPRRTIHLQRRATGRRILVASPKPSKDFLDATRRSHSR